jgi:hypothetical protein
MEVPMRKWSLLLLIAFASCGDNRRSAAPAAAAPEAAKPAGGSTGMPAKPLSRKLIRDGEIHVTVKEYEPARRTLEERLARAGGFVARTGVQHALGQVSQATLLLRIPAPRFEALVQDVLQLGTVEREAIGSRDVTDEYFDFEARLASARKLETRLLALVDKRADKLADLLEVERELARVRESIERLEGRLRLFDDQVDLCTLTVHLLVHQRYIPAHVASLGEEASGTFSGSLGSLGQLARRALLIGIALVPWSPLVAFPLWLVIRRRRRARV